MLTKIKEYFYKPQIGDIYFRDVKPGFLYDPWECEDIRKQDITIEDTKEGWVKFSYGNKIKFAEFMPVRLFKSRYTRRI